MDASVSPSLLTRYDFIMPLILSLLAGLSTCLGAAVVFCARRHDGKPPLNSHHLAFALSLAGSVMVTVSVASILPESFQDESMRTATRTSTTEEDEHNYVAVPFGSKEFMERCLSFAVGGILYVLLSRCAFPEPDELLGFHNHNSGGALPAHVVVNEGEQLVPLIIPLVRGDSGSNKTANATAAVKRIRSTVVPQQPSPTDKKCDLELAIHDDTTALSSPSSRKKNVASMFSGSDLTTAEARRSWRMAMLLFISLAVHNFPEGLAVAASTMHSHALGITTSIAIALHNIPEGIAIAVPCLAARPDAPWLAFVLASLSGLAEPLGAAVALLCLQVDTKGNQAADVSIMGNMKNVLAFVAGMMIMVSVRELFPEAARYSKDVGYVAFVAGTLTGMIAMLASDAVLEE